MKEILFLSVACVILGTGTGALLGIFFGLKSIGKTMAFTGGLMLGIVIFDLAPEALSHGNLPVAAAGIFAGVFFVFLAAAFINKGEKSPSWPPLYNVGIILMLAMALHNFPEGMAIGSSAIADFKSGLVVAFIITLHDIPEGMAVAAPLTAGPGNKISVFIATLISGLSTVAGALFGLWFGRMSTAGLAFCLAAAAGAMLYVVFGEMLPRAFAERKDKKIALITIIGIIMSGILLKIIK